MYEWAISVQRFQEVSKKVEPLTNEIKQLESQANELKQ